MIWLLHISPPHPPPGERGRGGGAAGSTCATRPELLAPPAGRAAHRAQVSAAGCGGDRAPHPARGESAPPAGIKIWHRRRLGTAACTRLPPPPKKNPKPPQKKTKKNAAGLMVGRACQHLVLKNTLKLGGKKEKRRFFRRCPMLVEVTARTWEPSSSVAPPRVHRRPPRRGKGRTKRSLALHGVSARGPPGNARQPTTCSSRRARRWQAARRRELGRTGSERRSRGKKRARGCRSPGRLSAPAGGDARRRGAHRQHPHLGRDGQT